MFSQNLSPNIICCLGEKNYKHMIIVTTVDPEENTLKKKRAEFLQKVKENHALFVNYMPELPDNTLVRITGPMIGYCLIAILKRLTSMQELTS